MKLRVNPILHSKVGRIQEIEHFPTSGGSFYKFWQKKIIERKIPQGIMVTPFDVGKKEFRKINRNIKNEYARIISDKF